MLLNEAEHDGVEIIPLNSNELRIQGWTDESRRWIAIIEDRAPEILLHLRRYQARTAADAVLAAESIIRAAKSSRRKRAPQ
jgi:hypothetical protein